MTDASSSRPSKPRRRWFHFSLRTLLIGVTLVAGMLGAWREYVEPYRRQRETMAYIEDRGGEYKTEPGGPGWLRGLFGDDKFKNIIEISFPPPSPEFCDADLAHLEGLTSLRTLVLNFTGVSDAGLAHLKGLTNLQSLYLWHTRVSNDGLAHLEGLANLQMLVLDQTQVGDEGLEHLKGLTNLQELHLSSTQVSAAGLPHLKGLTNLQVLNLNWTSVSDAGVSHLTGLANLRDLSLYVSAMDAEVSDAGLAHLKRLTNLQRLCLNWSRVSDAGLLHLKGLTNLQDLNLSNTSVSDAGLSHLKGLTNLHRLNLDNTQVTDAGLAHLKGLSNLTTLKVCYTQVSDAGARREDSEWQSQTVYDALKSHFRDEEVFFDIDTILPGVDFRQELNDAVDQCDVLIAMIGKRWLEVDEVKNTRRIDDPNDLVRIEIEAALARGIPVIPVLVQRVTMPSEEELPSSLWQLSYQNAVELNAGRDFPLKWRA